MKITRINFSSTGHHSEYWRSGYKPYQLIGGSPRASPFQTSWWTRSLPSQDSIERSSKRTVTDFLGETMITKSKEGSVQMPQLRDNKRYSNMSLSWQIITAKSTVTIISFSSKLEDQQQLQETTSLTIPSLRWSSHNDYYYYVYDVHFMICYSFASFRSFFFWMSLTLFSFCNNDTNTNDNAQVDITWVINTLNHQTVENIFPC